MTKMTQKEVVIFLEIGRFFVLDLEKKRPKNQKTSRVIFG